MCRQTAYQEASPWSRLRRVRSRPSGRRPSWTCRTVHPARKTAPFRTAHHWSASGMAPTAVGQAVPALTGRRALRGIVAARPRRPPRCATLLQIQRTQNSCCRGRRRRRSPGTVPVAGRTPAVRPGQDRAEVAGGRYDAERPHRQSPASAGADGEEGRRFCCRGTFALSTILNGAAKRQNRTALCRRNSAQQRHAEWRYR